MMIIYEVNIDVEQDRFDEYLAWLLPHTEAMRAQIQGLTQIICTRRECEEKGWSGLTVLYFVDTKEALDEYLTHRAAAMRQDAVTRFGSSMRATRRFLHVL